MYTNSFDSIFYSSLLLSALCSGPPLVVTDMAKLLVVLFLLLLTRAFAATAAPVRVYNVLHFGGRPDGRTDSRRPFLRTWTAARKSASPATIFVPRGTFLLNPVTFTGPCRSRIVFQIDGILVAPWGYNALGSSGYWILFYKVARFLVLGGTLDARGAAFWSCRGTGARCPPGARSMTFLASENVKVRGLTSMNSQGIHIAINECKNVMVQNVNIRAPSGSPNTDGLHVQSSTGITISGGLFRTGDDCISIGPGTSNVWIRRIRCGPGHGISIGSLGNDLRENGVKNVTVTNSVFTKTQNGVRIKSWARPSNGFASNIFFRNLIMNNVANPIIIDQNYCPDGNGCPRQSSGVKVSQVTYSNIKGTSSTPTAMTFDCSRTNPCTGIRLQDIKLTQANGPANAYCANAAGTSSGVVIPNGCL